MNPFSSYPEATFSTKYKIGLALVFCVYFLAFIGSYMVHFKELTYPLFDDGMITLEYAKDFARHGTLTVGGDSQWTAGFTSWAWLLILSVLSFIPVSEFHLPLLVPFLNTGILVLSLWLFSRLSTALSGKPVGWAYWALVLTTPSILYWTLRGMEVPLSMLTVSLIANSVVAISRNEKPGKADLFTFLSISLMVPFIRPELSAVVLVCALYLLLQKRNLASISAVVLLGTGFLIYMILNKAAFNQYFTNSYFLKIVGVSELNKLMRGIWSIQIQLIHNSLYIVLFFAIIMIMAKKSNNNISSLVVTLKQRIPNLSKSLQLLSDFFKASPYAILILIVITITLSWIWVGGDSWEELPLLNRFIVVCVPIFCISAEKILSSSNQQIRTTAIAIAIGFIFLNTVYSIKTIGLGSFNDKKFSYIGYRLGEMFVDRAVTMHYWYGQPSYYASINQGRSIDGLGKIDPVVSRSHPMLSFKPGHDRWNHEHSIGGLKPDIITNLPCPAPHDLKFNCSTVWDEITIKYGYKPHTSSDHSVTLFVSPRRPDLNDPVEKLEADYVEFTKKL